MESTLIAADTAKPVFEVAEVDKAGKVRRRLRLNRAQFSKIFHSAQRSSSAACRERSEWHVG